MSHRNSLLFLLLISSATLTLTGTGCEDPYSQEGYEEYYVIESYLVAQNRLPPVRLSTTSPALDEYHFEDKAVSGATVEVHLLEEGPESPSQHIFSYEQTEAGIYVPLLDHEVLPRRTYRLEIDLPDAATSLQAYTTVPDTFTTVGGLADTVTYQSSVQPEITVTPSYYPGRQSVYVFNTIAMEPRADNLTPFYASQLDGDTELEDFVNNESPLTNEANFDINPDSTITLRYPWIGVAFFGENLIVTNTMDDNIYDFLRSQSVQLGGSTLPPGEIQNAIYNVEGGIGVFGSIASDTVRTYIKRPQQP
jgi:hypothetical protein